MKIAFDFDETLTCMLQSWLDFLNYKHGTNVSIEQCIYWDMNKLFPELDSEDIYKPLFLPVFWRSVKVREDMAELVNRLQEEGHTVYVATASHYATLVSKFEECLFKLFPMIDYRNVIILFNKSLLDADVLVDDNSDNLVGFKGKKILIDMPYNRNVSGDDILRAFNTDDIYKFINS